MTHLRDVLPTGCASLWAALTSLLLATTPVYAQSCTVTAGSCNFTTALLRVPTLSQLTNSTASLSLAPSGGSLGATDFTLGYAAAVTALTVSVETNASANQLGGTNASSVKVTWQASSASWSGTGCPFTVSDLTFSTSATGPFTAVPTTATTLLSGITSSTGAAGRQATLYFRTTVSWADTPAPSCTLPLTFTVGP